MLYFVIREKFFIIVTFLAATLLIAQLGAAVRERSLRSLLGEDLDRILESGGNRAWLVHGKELKHGVLVFCFQDLQSQVTAGEEELGQVKRQAEENEGILRQTVEQLNEVRLLSSLHVNLS